MQYRGEPLLPYDFNLGKEATDISAYLGDVLNKSDPFVVVFLLLFVALVWCRRKAAS